MTEISRKNRKNHKKQVPGVVGLKICVQYETPFLMGKLDTRLILSGIESVAGLGHSIRVSAATDAGNLVRSCLN